MSGTHVCPVACLLNAAFHYILHPQLATDLGDRYGFPLVGESRVAGDDKEAREP